MAPGSSGVSRALAAHLPRSSTRQSRRWESRAASCATANLPAKLRRGSALASQLRLHLVTSIPSRRASRTNRAEAEALVDYVFSRLADPSQKRRSAGVVTFSMAQKNLIEDVFEKRRAEVSRSSRSTGSSSSAISRRRLRRRSATVTPTETGRPTRGRGIRNLFGEKYFESARHFYECLVGEPRTFEIGLRARF